MCNLEERVKEKQELIELMKENGPEWMEAFGELMRSADGATPEQIAEVVEFLEDRKLADTEARLRDQIAEGEQIMKSATDRELSLWEFMVLKEISDNDTFSFAINAFLIGVFHGHKIGEVENDARQTDKQY